MGQQVVGVGWVLKRDNKKAKKREVGERRNDGKKLKGR